MALRMEVQLPPPMVPIMPPHDRTSAAVERINQVLAEFATPGWVKDGLRAAMLRDPVKAAAEAEVLHDLLAARADAVLDDAVETLWAPPLPFDTITH